MEEKMGTVSIQARSKESYDAAFKRFLSIKGIIAYIAKDQIREYHDLSLDEISTLIEGEPFVSSAKVDPGYTNSSIVGLNTESLFTDEGKATFDILTFIRSRDGVDQNAIIVNIEAQYSPNRNYPLGQRALYYATRNISSQKNRDVLGFKGDDYGSLHKVYSIWILPDFTSQSQSFVSSVVLEQKGSPLINQRYHFQYDFIELVFINVGVDWELQYNSIIGLMGVYLRRGESVESKMKQMREDFGIHPSEELKESFDSMSGMGQFIWDWSKQEATEKVTQQMRVDAVTAIMESLHMDFHSAYGALKYPPEEEDAVYQEYLSRKRD